MYRLVQEADIVEVGKLIKLAVDEMESQGIYQWDDIYPTVDDFMCDIKKQQLYAGIINGEIAVVYVVNKECDEAYETGAWKYQNSEYRVIHRFCVNPKYQNKGIAKAVLKHIEKELVTQKVETIRLDVYSENPYALKLYFNNAYEKVGFADWRKGRFFLMEKNLLASIYTEEDLFPKEITTY
jgi:ribosomal protein S18 acetylase RimI-like enzyme